MLMGESSSVLTPFFNFNKFLQTFSWSLDLQLFSVTPCASSLLLSLYLLGCSECHRHGTRPQQVSVYSCVASPD